MSNKTLCITFVLTINIDVAILFTMNVYVLLTNMSEALNLFDSNRCLPIGISLRIIGRDKAKTIHFYIYLNEIEKLCRLHIM